jgi:hypothetical protein
MGDLAQPRLGVGFFDLRGPNEGQGGKQQEGETHGGHLRKARCS